MTTFGLQSNHEESETDEMTRRRPLIRTYQLDCQDRNVESPPRKIRALEAHSDNAQRIICANENRADEMPVETSGKDSAAEFDHEKAKYTTLKRKFYELDEKSLVLLEERANLRILYIQKLETLEKMEARNADIKMEAANGSMDMMVAEIQSLKETSISEKLLLAEQREAARKLEEKCAQLQIELDVGHKHPNALSTEKERSAREIERLTKYNEQIENRLIVSLDEINKISLEAQSFKKASINFEILLKEKGQALDKAQKEFTVLQNKSSILCEERDQAVEALSREREAWAVNIAAKDDALTNLKRHFKEKYIQATSISDTAGARTA